MTTINNSENLIEKVGGIEKAREIVEGAHWENISYSNGSYYSHSCGKNDICLEDLRTAIAKHDEFKVGDLVVCTDDFEGRGLTAKDIALFITVKRIAAFIDDWGLDLNNGEHWVDIYRFRHATPEEIKAGHRLEAERHG